MKSVVDIIFKDAQDQLTFKSIKVSSIDTSIVGFVGEIIIPKGIVILPSHWVKLHTKWSICTFLSGGYFKRSYYHLY